MNNELDADGDPHNTECGLFDILLMSTTSHSMISENMVDAPDLDILILHSIEKHQEPRLTILTSMS